MRIKKYRLINIFMVTFIPIIIGTYFILKGELNELIINSEVKPYKEDGQNEDFELALFLSKLEKYDNISVDNITFYDDWGELKIGCEGDLNNIKQLLNSLKGMEEIKEVADLSIKNNWCEFLVIFNK